MTAELLIRKFWDAYNDRNALAMAELFADDAIIEYAGGMEKPQTLRGSQDIGVFFEKMIGNANERLGHAQSFPKTVLTREGLAVVEWSSVLSDKKTGASLTTRGVNVCEVENGKFAKMTVYLPSPSEPAFAPLGDKLSIRDLGELSLVAWAIV